MTSASQDMQDSRFWRPSWKNGEYKKMLNIWSLAPNGFGFSSSKPNGNHHKSLYMSQNKVQLPNAWIKTLNAVNGCTGHAQPIIASVKFTLSLLTTGYFQS